LFFERPELGRQAVLLHIHFDSPRSDGDGRALSSAPHPQETRELAEGAGMDVVAIVEGRRRTPHPRQFVGSGKLDELKQVMRHEQADLLLLNHDIAPNQQRNLEQALNARVMPRTELILHIFADRARSHEGQMQVELAQLRHAQSRLVRGWTHLDRQKGGIGLRGAGETQIELDQRMLGERIKITSAKLETVAARRARSRKRRTRQRALSVALVGYTNAGKSTLFNALTTAEVLAEDRLFATLDPTLRRLPLPGLGDVVLSDTVGFISHLPHALVNAFHSTLEEAVHADLLLHVVDAAADDMLEQIMEVNAVLANIGAGDVPRLLVLNKIDTALSKEESAAGEPGEAFRDRLLLLDSAASAVPDDLSAPAPEGGEQPPLGSLAPEVQRCAVSAVTGAGLDALRTAITAELSAGASAAQVELHPGDGKTRAWLYRQGAVVAETISPDGKLLLDLKADDALLEALARRSDLVLRAVEGDPRIAALPN
jgi:GTP-binding protein HflX